MKIDVEGFEMVAFRGMHETLTAHPPKAIICEVSFFGGCLAKPDELIRHLLKYGYVAYRITHTGLATYRDGDPLYPDRDKDFAFIRPDCTGQVADLVHFDWH
jgi:hypothetical protein